MRPEPWRLDPANYPAALGMETRFGDLDPLGHLNNVAVGRFYEEGRVRFTGSVEGRSLWNPGGRVLVARVAVDYLREGFHPRPVAVHTGVLRLGASSYAFGQLLTQDGAPIGLCETVLVYTEDGRPAPLPPRFRDALAERRITQPPTD